MSKPVSAVAAGMRIVYAGIFAVAVVQLTGAARLLGGTSLLASGAARVQAQALSDINRFTDIWDAGLIVFGLYLLVIAGLAWRSGYVPRLLGVLVAIAGLGYIYDSIGQFVSGGSWTQVSTVTFIGEFLLALWLVIRGRRITVSQPVLRAEAGRASAMTAATPGAAAAATMTAIAQDQYGTAPEAVLRLAEITRPAIADDEILVRVHAASVDRGTWRLMAGSTP